MPFAALRYGDCWRRRTTPSLILDALDQARLARLQRRLVLELVVHVELGLLDRAMHEPLLGRLGVIGGGANLVEKTLVGHDGALELLELRCDVELLGLELALAHLRVGDRGRGLDDLGSFSLNTRGRTHV